MLIARCESYKLDSVRESQVWDDFPEVKDKTVFVKPNLVVPPTPQDRQSVTHPRVLEAVLCRLRDGGVGKIIVGCCGFKGQWQKTVELGGYDKVCAKHDAELICVQDGPNYHKYTRKRIEDEGYLSLYGAELSDFVLESDLLINLPKLKVHWMAGITCSIKNMMGIMKGKGGMHPSGASHTLHKRLRDLYVLTRPLVSWILVDGIEGSGYAEHSGVPVRSDVLIAGTDMFEVDCWASQVMGINPEQVGYLKYIKEEDEKDWPVQLDSEWVTRFPLPLTWR